MKLIVRVDGNSENNIKKNALFFFENHINRSVKFGLRDKKSVIYDQFVNKYHNYLSIRKIFKTIDKNFTFVHTWPQGGLSRSDSARNDSLNKNKDLVRYLRDGSVNFAIKTSSDKENLNKKKKFFEELEKISLTLNKVLKYNKNFLRGFDNQISEINKEYDYDQKKIFIFKKEVKKILDFLARKKVDKLKLLNIVKNTKVLFKKQSGLGINYFIFRKH